MLFNALHIEHILQRAFIGSIGGRLCAGSVLQGHNVRGVGGGRVGGRVIGGQCSLAAAAGSRVRFDGLTATAAVAHFSLVDSLSTPQRSQAATAAAAVAAAAAAAAPVAAAAAAGLTV